MIRFTNYSKSYGSKLVLQVPELELNSGVYWLRGENGSGKTTLLKSVAGLTPFNGSIAVQSISIKQAPVKYRQLVSYAEAEPLYPSFLTGGDLLSFYKQTRGAAQEQVTELADALGVSSFSGQKIGTYSSGMIKKLSLVLAFTGAPDLVLLDEPFITLDQEALQVLPGMISRLAEKGVSFIISSHQAFDSLQPATLHLTNHTINLQAATC